MARTVGATTRTMRRQPRAQHRAWQSMRILLSFTIGDLMATAEISRDNCQKYLLGLERAGYVRRIAERASGHRGAAVKYRLIRNTGPQAPTLYRGQIRDLNPGAQAPSAETIHG